MTLRIRVFKTGEALPTVLDPSHYGSFDVNWGATAVGRQAPSGVGSRFTLHLNRIGSENLTELDIRKWERIQVQQNRTTNLLELYQYDYDWNAIEAEWTLIYVGAGTKARGVQFNYQINPTPNMQFRTDEMLSTDTYPIAKPTGVNLHGFRFTDISERDEIRPTEFSVSSYLRNFEIATSTVTAEDLTSETPKWRCVALPPSDTLDTRTPSITLNTATQIHEINYREASSIKWQADQWQAFFKVVPFNHRTKQYHVNFKDLADNRDGTSPPGVPKTRIFYLQAHNFDGGPGDEDEFFGFTGVTNNEQPDTMEWNFSVFDSSTLQLITRRWDRRGFDGWDTPRFTVTFWDAQGGMPGETKDFAVGDSDKIVIPQSRFAYIDDAASSTKITSVLELRNTWAHPTVQFSFYATRDQHLQLKPLDVVNVNFRNFNHRALITGVSWLARERLPELITLNCILYKDLT